MIIQALNQYYDILARDDRCTIPKLGYSTAKVSFVLQISEDGQLSHVIDIRTKDKKPRPRELTVPKQDSRANTIRPYFLCDNAKYIFGVDVILKKDREKNLNDSSKNIRVLDDTGGDLIVITKRSQDCFEAFKALQHSILDNVELGEVRSFLKFIDSWKPENSLQNEKITEYKDDILSGSFFVFEIAGSGNKYLHQFDEIRRAWEKLSLCDNEDTTTHAHCLVTGNLEPISETHQKIKGVTGAQPAGASLVSFNAPAFCSYGKEQSYNAPIGITAEFKYTTVLNYLLADLKSRIRIGDNTVVFWAETADRSCEDLALSLFNPPSGSDEENPDGSENEENHSKDVRTIQLIRDILTKVRNSEPINQQVIGTEPETRFYILGLSPNNARLAIRFWYQDSFGHFIERIARHHLDLEIVRGDYGPPFISVYRLLQESIPRTENAEVSPLLAGLMFSAILNGTPYPVQMYYAILNRIKVERSINYIRAGFIKAYLLRISRSGRSSFEENLITMSLNEESKNVPYRLGRLFAVLEKVQSETNKEMGSTINSKYFSSASSTPAVVFPVLLKLAQHHIAKSDWGFKTDQAIKEILSEVSSFPAFLSLEDQGLFMLGYYHQKQSFFIKKQDSKEE
nr:type I-C CRISPR-associated protein Cas8c/Csd1 [uncultured Methanospirillum sp.]